MMLTGIEVLGLFEHLNLTADLSKDLLMVHFHLIGLVLATIPEDEREAALDYAARYMHAGVEAWNKRLDGAMKNT